MARRVEFFITCIVAIVLVAGTSSCTVAPASRYVDAQIVKSDNDKRKYQYIELPNQLRVLLISDANTDKAAASLDVFVGSAQDPQTHQGLAHFLEHMLFLGTEKYPEAGAYQSFINQHNGHHNAYTSFEHTNYFFDIDPAHLDSALDRFSQFFIAPLFTQSYVEREKNAVHSEYMAKIKTEQRRALEVFKSVVNPKHPFAKFSVGNLQTLSDDKEQHGSLRGQLLAFYHQHYSANVMTLVVMGREPLEDLEQMVRTKFSAIPNSNKQVETISEPLFSAGTLPLRINIEPLKQQRVMTLSFPIPAHRPLYRQKPVHYLGNIIGHEGQGSLLSYLIEQGLALGLSAGSGLSYQGGSQFTVTIQLTPKGLMHSEHVIDSVFQTINRIKQSGPKQWLFNEQSALAWQQFRYLEPSAPAHYVSRVASDIHYYPAPLVLNGPYLMDRYDASVIELFLQHLNPDNVVVSLTAPGVAVDSTSHFYKTRYQATTVSKKVLKRWHSVGLNPQITLPVPNEFIAEDLSVTGTEDASSVPILLSEQNGLRVWFKNDDQYQTPKGSVIFRVRSAKAHDTPEHSVRLQMYLSMVDEQLKEFSYPAMLAGLHYAIDNDNLGFSVKIHGFNDKQALLLEKIVTALREPVFDAQRFLDIKQERIRQLSNTSKQQPYRQLMRKLPQLLYKNKWTDKQLLHVYKTTSVDDVERYVKQLLSRVDIQMLVYGNYTQAQSQQFAQRVNASLLNNSSSSPAVSIAKLLPGERTYKMDSEYADASLLFYLQGRELTKQTRAAMGVTAHWLRSDFYTQLRTEKQLGYVVMAGAYPLIDVPGMIFMVQSPVAGPKLLKKHFQDFIQQKRQEVDALPESVFDLHRQALINRLSELPKNQWKQSERFWQDIVLGYSNFDSRKQLIDALKALEFEQWRDFFKEQIAGSERRGMWVFSAGQFIDLTLTEPTLINSVSEFKNNSDYYQFH